MNRLHTLAGLLQGGRPANHCPHLRIEVNLPFRIVLGAIHCPIVTDGPNKPIAIPSNRLNIAVQEIPLLPRPSSFVFFTETMGDLFINCESKPHLESYEQAFPIITQFETVIPISRQAAGKTISTAPFQIELQGTAQVAKNGILALVSIGQHLPVEVKISCFSHIGWNSVKQPQTIVGAIFLGLWLRFVSRPVLKGFDHWQRSAC